VRQLTSILFLFSLCVLSQFTGTAQEDTVRTEKKLNKKAIYGNARKATVMSAILPGLGQAYNRKWWKIPIVYAGLGGFGYLFYSNQTSYSYYSKNLRAVYDEDPETVNETEYNGDQLLVLKNDHRKYRDLGFIGMAVIYAFNIIDANVDAHLKTFDVSDDLSLSIRPYSNFYGVNNSIGMQNGLSLSLNFKNRGSHRSAQIDP
jgi:hypothetical protein